MTDFLLQCPSCARPLRFISAVFADNTERWRCDLCGAETVLFVGVPCPRCGTPMDAVERREGLCRACLSATMGITPDELDRWLAGRPVWSAGLFDVRKGSDATEPARDAAQSAKFEHYLSDQYADDDATLTLDVQTRDAEQLRQFRREMDGLHKDD